MIDDSKLMVDSDLKNMIQPESLAQYSMKSYTSNPNKQKNPDKHKNLNRKKNFNKEKKLSTADKNQKFGKKVDVKENNDDRLNVRLDKKPSIIIEKAESNNESFDYRNQNYSVESSKRDQRNESHERKDSNHILSQFQLRRSNTETFEQIAKEKDKPRSKSKSKKKRKKSKRSK